MAPEPGLVSRVLGKREAKRFETGDLFVEVLAFEIEDDGRRRHTPDGSCFRLRCDVYGKRCVAVGTFEPGVSRQGIDDPFETELFEELDGFDGELAVDRYLVEVHYLGNF